MASSTPGTPGSVRSSAVSVTAASAGGGLPFAWPEPVCTASEVAEAPDAEVLLRCAALRWGSVAPHLLAAVPEDLAAPAWHARLCLVGREVPDNACHSPIAWRLLVAALMGSPPGGQHAKTCRARARRVLRGTEAVVQALFAGNEWQLDAPATPGRARDKQAARRTSAQHQDGPAGSPFRSPQPPTAMVTQAPAPAPAAAAAPAVAPAGVQHGWASSPSRRRVLTAGSAGSPHSASSAGHAVGGAASASMGIGSPRSPRAPVVQPPWATEPAAPAASPTDATSTAGDAAGGAGTVSDVQVVLDFGNGEATAPSPVHSVDVAAADSLTNKASGAGAGDDAGAGAGADDGAGDGVDEPSVGVEQDPLPSVESRGSVPPAAPRASSERGDSDTAPQPGALDADVDGPPAGGGDSAAGDASSSDGTNDGVVPASVAEVATAADSGDEGEAADEQQFDAADMTLAELRNLMDRCGVNIADVCRGDAIRSPAGHVTDGAAARACLSPADALRVIAALATRHTALSGDGNAQ